MPTVALVLAFGAIGAACDRREKPAPPSDGAPTAASIEDVLVRERFVALFEQQEQLAQAEALLAPLAARPEPLVRDLVWLAQVQIRQGKGDEALATIERARQLDPKDVGTLYTYGRLRYLLGFDEDVYADTRAAYEATLAAAPDDPAARIELARVLEDAGAPEDLPRVRELLDEVIALGLENGTGWYVTAVYRRHQLALNSGDEEAERVYGALWQALSESKLEALRDHELDQGTVARVAAPPSIGTFPAKPPALPTYGATRTLLPELAGAAALEVRDIDGDRRPDLVGHDDRGAFVALQGKDGWTVLRVADGDVAAVRALDLNQGRGGDTLDLAVLARDGTLTVWEQSDALGAPVTFTRSPVAVPPLGGAGADLAVVDFDHDGDLDLFAVGAAGAKLWRNDGAGVSLSVVRDPAPSEEDPSVPPPGETKPRAERTVELPRGAWVDASEEASLPTGALTWCAIEDLDGDQDIDLLCGGPEATHLLSSLRGGRFEDVSWLALDGAALGSEPVLADLDGDGRVDLFEPGAPARLWRQTQPLRFAAAPLGVDVPPGLPVQVADLDLDGAADLAFAVDGRFGRAVLAAGLAQRALVDLPPIEGPAPAAGAPLVVAELDAPDAYGLLGHELLRVTPAGLATVAPSGGLGHGLYVKFFGKKDNRQAVGAVLEVRARALYRRILLRGEPELVGLGPHEQADVMRVTWPNGVKQHRTDVERGVDIANPDSWMQSEGLAGSCPFLYTWNGTTFTFVSDVLGITPLGLPMAPGLLVPPDHDEYVLVRAEQLVPDEHGQYVLQFTEELREVTYLDRVRLDVIDHPADAEVFPDERFTFPPFPPAHLHTLQGALAPLSARGSDGGDWTAALAREDDVHAVNLTRLGGQFLGLAEPHWLELAFEREAVERAPRLRLLCTGWFYWTDASVNMATARTPGIEFVPPIVEVPDGAGGWRPIGPPVGFPAGKTKSMVIDLTEHLVRDDPRVRLRSSLELYWDRIALAVCGDDAPRRVTAVEPAAATLWARGFSRPVPDARPDQPERFAWDELETEPRWNQHPGHYTRYGDVLPLVTEVDDRFVILGAGDALTLRFDAAGLPPLPTGWRRDFLVFLDGWAKDRDPNTIEALTVEPLPFHGMSGYPYGPDESFPDTPMHRAWRAEWNTRPAHDWIVPLAPRLVEEWTAEAARALVTAGAGPQ